MEEEDNVQFMSFVEEYGGIVAASILVSLMVVIMFVYICNRMMLETEGIQEGRSVSIGTTLTELSVISGLDKAAFEEDQNLDHDSQESQKKSKKRKKGSKSKSKKTTNKQQTPVKRSSVEPVNRAFSLPVNGSLPHAVGGPTKSHSIGQSSLASKSSMKKRSKRKIQNLPPEQPKFPEAQKTPHYPKFQPKELAMPPGSITRTAHGSPQYSPEYNY